jgi:hypothetical protein
MRRWSICAVVFSSLAGAVLLDRIAVVVNNQPIKDSDIDRDLRVTEMLNGKPLDITAAARKQAASRLIDQALIRREMRVARYAEATPEQASKLLAQVRGRYASETAYQAALRRHGLTIEQLRKQLTWQMTVLDFIDQRFRPAILVSDAEVQDYYQQHRSQYGSSPLADVRDKIEQQLTEERVNQQFFDWLDQARKNASIEYLEPDLK